MVLTKSQDRDQDKIHSAALKIGTRPLISLQVVHRAAAFHGRVIVNTDAEAAAVLHACPQLRVITQRGVQHSRGMLETQRMYAQVHFHVQRLTRRRSESVARAFVDNHLTTQAANELLMNRSSTDMDPRAPELALAEAELLGLQAQLMALDDTTSSPGTNSPAISMRTKFKQRLFICGSVS